MSLFSAKVMEINWKEAVVSEERSQNCFISNANFNDVFCCNLNHHKTITKSMEIYHTLPSL